MFNFHLCLDVGNVCEQVWISLVLLFPFETLMSKSVNICKG